MSQLVTNTATCQCTFGIAPAPLIATSAITTLALGQPAATIMDLPKVPFGMCTCVSNPAVAAATAAAMGVLTPMPCTPLVMAPWVPGSPTVLIGNIPALNSTSKAMCTFGGVIQIAVTPAVTVQVP